MHFVRPNFSSAHTLLYKRASDIRALRTDTLTIPLYLRTNSVHYCFVSNVSNASIDTLIPSYREVKGYDMKKLCLQQYCISFPKPTTSHFKNSRRQNGDVKQVPH